MICFLLIFYWHLFSINCLICLPFPFCHCINVNSILHISHRIASFHVVRLVFASANLPTSNCLAFESLTNNFSLREFVQPTGKVHRLKMYSPKCLNFNKKYYSSPFVRKECILEFYCVQQTTHLKCRLKRKIIISRGRGKNIFLVYNVFSICPHLSTPFICKVRPIHGRELVIKCAAQTAREARLYARELTIIKFVSSICARGTTILSTAICAKRLGLQKQRPKENNNKVNLAKLTCSINDAIRKHRT